MRSCCRLLPPACIVRPPDCWLCCPLPCWWLWPPACCPPLLRLPPLLLLLPCAMVVSFLLVAHPGYWLAGPGTPRLASGSACLCSRARDPGDRHRSTSPSDWLKRRLGQLRSSLAKTARENSADSEMSWAPTPTLPRSTGGGRNRDVHL